MNVRGGEGVCVCKVLDEGFLVVGFYEGFVVGDVGVKNRGG